VLRGNHTAKIDDKGRLKIPNAFRALIESQHGTDVFVTSISGEDVLIFPMPVWAAREEKLAAMPSQHPARRRFLDRVNYYGQVAVIDGQGRVIIHPRLREAAGMTGDVDVIGQMDHLDVWNHDRFVSRMQTDPLTTEDLSALVDYGI
jgi:MraZ protein